ncbi:MFS transporter [Desarmillaria tabescens]|uniref:MFS transporter n=1 Tax=Armillaria tabescens TaxID=1929756 RepID=A0AA39NQT6_ARMTA|nr:MFS transporter [Desarmillaria tabescens]KAK0469985.1 MFS transporter [Desarmillaria tabescens]
MESRHCYSSAIPTPTDDKEYGETVIAAKGEGIIDRAAEKKLLWQLDLRIITTFVLMYMLSFFASVNIGNARILDADTGDSILQVLHMSDHQFVAVLAIYVVSYALFEVPSNYLLKHFSPPIWLAFLMFGWGATVMILAASQNYSTVLGLRFLLGVFEGGLVPGMIYVFTFWYRLEERALRLSLIIAAGPLGAAFGGCIAYGVGALNGNRGLEAWRWLFIIEGAPSCLLAILVLFFLPSYPEKASGFSPDDRALAILRLEQESSKSVGHATVTWAGAKSTFLDWRLYLHHFADLVVLVPLTSISLFAPTIVDGLGYEGRDAQLFTVPPFAVAFVATVSISWVADRYRVWSMCAMVSMALAGVTFLVHEPRGTLQGSLPPMSFKARYAMLCLGTTFAFMSTPSLVAWFTGNLRDTNATTLAIPMYIAFGAMGQLIALFIYKPSEAPGYPTGHYTNAAVLLMGAACVELLRIIYKRRNKELDAGQSPWIV